MLAKTLSKMTETKVSDTIFEDLGIIVGQKRIDSVK